MQVKIIDPNHPCYGQELGGSRIYFDYYHRGGKPDLYQAEAPEGGFYRLLTNQIDEEHYEAQELAREVERLSANVGDTVMITRMGSGGSKANFDIKEPHVITKITPSGTVYFDDGEANGFRPDVIVISKDKLQP
ncbi:hypothetical protein M2444_003585 [Paenibacillus sp. PastF-3]|uniref:hypothetical protein n=1 Tax=Paenibacillus sp. PastF-3 TaxID=2940626 RepID=UPI00247577F6|nr:hypothetical protein [Paenibacillus sp. PastF-3]MDH6371786.1 hypothetical protein [Paenibacillus sp. PastF-3]